VTRNIPILIMWWSIFYKRIDFKLCKTFLQEMMELGLIDIISMAPTEESENSVDTADVRTNTEA
jgi:hypothetical protein